MALKSVIVELPRLTYHNRNLDDMVRGMNNKSSKASGSKERL